MQLTQGNRDLAQLRASVCSTHATYLKTPTQRFKQGGLTWRIATDDTLYTDLHDVWRAVQELETQPEQWLKRSNINLVSRATIGTGVFLVKRYDLPRHGQKLRYRFRPSRARRAWAAAWTLRTFGFRTPKPHAFVESCRGTTPEQCFYVHEYLDQATTARRWIKAHLHRAPGETRDLIRLELSHSLLELYRHGMYHGDTKTGNLLVTDPESSEKRQWHWIDLECLQVGVRATRRRVLRNLVQLNGSIGSKISEADRIAFLHDLADEFPWITRPHVEQLIRYRSMKRLSRELTGECGH